MEEKKGALLPRLKLFEVVSIVKLMPARSKQTVLALLNRDWQALISKPYAWACFPSEMPSHAYHHFSRFIRSFPNLESIKLPFIPSQLVGSLIPVLSSASSLSLDWTNITEE